MALRIRTRQEARAREPRTRAQWAMVVAGWALVVGSVGILGWASWQVWGTNWVSAGKQADGLRALEQQWAEGQDFALVDGRQVTSVVRIPRFGSDYEMPLVEGVTDEALAAGFGHFAESVAPGEQGNFALAAHRVTHGEPLRAMPKLRAGDEIVIETREATYTYVLDSGGTDLEVPFTSTWVLDAVPRNPDGGTEPPQQAGRQLITLMTCAELFHTDDRLVAFGHLESREPR